MSVYFDRKAKHIRKKMENIEFISGNFSSESKQHLHYWLKRKRRENVSINLPTDPKYLNLTKSDNGDLTLRWDISKHYNDKSFKYYKVDQYVIDDGWLEVGKTRASGVILTYLMPGYDYIFRVKAVTKVRETEPLIIRHYVVEANETEDDDELYCRPNLDEILRQESNEVDGGNKLPVMDGYIPEVTSDTSASSLTESSKKTETITVSGKVNSVSAPRGGTRTTAMESTTTSSSGSLGTKMSSSAVSSSKIFMSQTDNTYLTSAPDSTVTYDNLIYPSHSSGQKDMTSDLSPGTSLHGIYKKNNAIKRTGTFYFLNTTSAKGLMLNFPFGHQNSGDTKTQTDQLELSERVKSSESTTCTCTKILDGSVTKLTNAMFSASKVMTTSSQLLSKFSKYVATKNQGENQFTSDARYEMTGIFQRPDNKERELTTDITLSITEGSKLTNELLSTIINEAGSNSFTGYQSSGSTKYDFKGFQVNTGESTNLPSSGSTQSHDKTGSTFSIGSQSAGSISSKLTTDLLFGSGGKAFELTTSPEVKSPSAHSDFLFERLTDSADTTSSGDVASNLDATKMDATISKVTTDNLSTTNIEQKLFKALGDGTGHTTDDTLTTENTKLTVSVSALTSESSDGTETKLTSGTGKSSKTGTGSSSSSPFTSTTHL